MKKPSCIVYTPSVCGGEARIVGTRIRAEQVALLFFKRGLSIDEIVAEFAHPRVHGPAVEACLRWWARGVTPRWEF